MKINVGPSKSYDCVELHFSDGSFINMDFKNAEILQQALARAICLAISYGEEAGGWGEQVANVECSDMQKEF